MWTKIDLIRRQGNRAVHDRMATRPGDALGAVHELFHVMFWLARTYAPNPEDRPSGTLVFNGDAIPRPLTVEQRQATAEALRKRQEENERRDEELRRRQEENDGLRAQLAELRAQVAEAKTANLQVPDAHDYNEAKTRTDTSTCFCTRLGGRSIKSATASTL